MLPHECGICLQGFGPTQPSACTDVECTTWLAVSVPVHPKGDGGTRPGKAFLYCIYFVCDSLVLSKQDSAGLMHIIVWHILVVSSIKMSINEKQPQTRCIQNIVFMIKYPICVSESVGTRRCKYIHSGHGEEG